MTRAELLLRLNVIAGEDMKATKDTLAFEDSWVPDRWFRECLPGYGPLMRCENDHVSTQGLQTEDQGILCFGCWAKVVWTFPEDENGPLEDSWTRLQKLREKDQR